MSIRSQAVRCRSGAGKGEGCRSSRGSDAAGLVQSAKVSALSLQSDLLWRAICVSVTHARLRYVYIIVHRKPVFKPVFVISMGMPDKNMNFCVISGGQ